MLRLMAEQGAGGVADEYRGWASDRPFTAVEKRIIDHFIEEWAESECPVCKRNEWNISGPAQLHSYAAGDLTAGRHFPLIPVACTNCGYTVLFNARIVGLTLDDLLEWERSSAKRLPESTDPHTGPSQAE